LAVGVAVVDTASELLAGQLDGLHVVGLHWPNDVFVSERKLAGILIDVLPDGRHVIGIGLNVNNSLAGAPTEVRRRATTLKELTGTHFDRTGVLLSLLANLEHALRQTHEDRAWLARRFDELCLQTGKPLTIEVGSQRTSGICAGIAADGALLLDTATGRQRFVCGVLIHELPA
jgi:BirA family biotin operon repressor/biotin-[acetyl-CoA-carboxylase] ligase